MNEFVFGLRLPKVVFGPGSLQSLSREIDAMGATRTLILCTAEQTELAKRVQVLLGARAVGLFPGALMHVPLETARQARAEAARLGADCAVAVGGGSTTGLGKAIALDSGLPIISVPTTYAGSEMTSIYGITEEGIKKTGRDRRVLPQTVMYDPELTISLPWEMTVTSAMNAVAHAAEGLYAHDGNPIISLMAEEGIRAIAAALKTLAVDPTDISARGDALYGAWLCGAVLGSASMGLHHKLCHTLGGTFNLPHAQLHTVILPHAIAYNTAFAKQPMARAARAINSPDAANGLYELSKMYGAPTSLKSLGMKSGELRRAAELAVQNQYPNPRPLEISAILALLERAYEGLAPVHA